MFPVYKKGNKRDIDNYRGISALCAVSKLFELAVLDLVFFHCKQQICAEQHGFMPGRSTTSNLLTFTTFLTKGLASRSQTDVIYTDLSAAFDRLNHDIAIAKLEKLGFSGSLLGWFQSYLSRRTISVKIGECVSLLFLAYSGVAQGSHLGPLIFLLYFNDSNFVLDGPRLAYADDLKIFRYVNSTHDAELLQQQLDKFADWCATNRMTLNPLKCSVISFTRKLRPITHNYTLLGTTVPRVECINDLGVLLDAKLTYKNHVAYIVAKASRLLGFIFRATKKFTDVYCLKSLYCGLVRSTLEYSSVVWNPWYQNSSERIESVQRRFIRFALRLLPWRDPHRLPSYESRCQLIHLDSLAVRRNAARVTAVADLLTSRIDCPSLLGELNLQARSRVLRGGAFFRIPLEAANYSAHGSIIGLQRTFNRVASIFDFNVSRDVLKKQFLEFFRCN